MLVRSTRLMRVGIVVSSRKSPARSSGLGTISSDHNPERTDSRHVRIAPTDVSANPPPPEVLYPEKLLVRVFQVVNKM